MWQLHPVDWHTILKTDSSYLVIKEIKNAFKLPTYTILLAVLFYQENNFYKN